MPYPPRPQLQPLADFVNTNRSGVRPPAALVEFVAAQYQAGRSLREIAELTDRSHGAVRNILDRLGVQRRGAGAPLMNTDLDVETALETAPHETFLPHDDQRVPTRRDGD